jgi:hypothetical protein
MKRRLYAPAVLFIGLLSAQIVATVHVYMSNRDLLRTTEVLIRNGYLAVPNIHVAERLDALITAMAGGLFFTLSIGAGLSLTTLACAWLWRRVLRSRRRDAILYLAIWILALFLINGNGLNVAASSYFIVVPLVTWIAAVKLLPPSTTLVSSSCVILPVSAAVIIALLWSLVLDRQLFVNIRDYLLLPNPVGRSITDAYYAYTLFPAEAFKSLRQKQIRTCVLEVSLDRPNREKLDQTFRNHDYLPLPSGSPADLTIGQDSTAVNFSLKVSGDPVLTVPVDEIFGDPQQALAAFSDKRDRNRVFRKLTLVCLLIGFPLMLYGIMFSLLSMIPNLFLTTIQSNVIAAVGCVLVGAILLMPVYRGHSASVVSADAIDALASPSTDTRIAGLRRICEDRKTIAFDARWQALEKSPSIAERYWLARSLAYAEGPEIRGMLQRLADDPTPIVACQALWAMGERHNRSSVAWIIDRINTDSHWYVQMYAYRALRSLRWVQPRSRLLSF